MVGEHLSHYEILEKLGEGGMGVAYKARDLRLDRFVVIKLLHGNWTKDEGRRRRFTEEAKSASSLNDPNIITIHEIDEHDGQQFIVMEFVPGKTLDQMIARGGLPVRDVLRYGIAITSALTTAHSAGIIHRDIKPSNIIVGASGAVKVLDFGLAKVAREGQSGGADETQTKLTTTDGVILGTPAYMSPEQAQGKAADGRSDVFSVGVVMYEMLTRRRPFTGSDRISTLAAVIQAEVQRPTELDPRIPQELERVVLRCLRKDPDRRFQNMADLKVALEELKEESESGRLGSGAQSAGRGGRQKRVLITALLLVFAAAIGSGAWVVWRSRMEAASRSPTLTRLTWDGRSLYGVVSRDGSLIAYMGGRAGHPADVWVRQTSGEAAIQITHEPLGVLGLSISPDGSKIAYATPKGSVYEIPTLGGDPRVIRDSGYADVNYLPDGKILLTDTNLKLFLLSDDRASTRPIAPEYQTVSFAIAPDGKKLISRAGRPDSSDQSAAQWALISLPDGSVKNVPAPKLPAEEKAGPAIPLGWMKDPDNAAQEWILYGVPTEATTTIYKSVISPDGRLTSAPKLLVTAPGGVVAATPSAAGTAVLNLSTVGSSVSKIPMDTNSAKVTGERERLVDVEGAVVQHANVSRDGRKVAFGKAGGVYVRDLDTGREQKLADGANPEISPDGSFALYMPFVVGRRFGLSRVSVNGGEKRTIVDSIEDFPDVKGLSSDGGAALVQLYSMTHRTGRIALLNLKEAKLETVLQDQKNSLWHASYSWDDAWVTFKRQIDDFHHQIVITPARNYRPESAEKWIPVTSGGFWDDKPAFSPDGNTVYFTSNRDGFSCFWAQRLDRSTKRPTGPAFAIHHLHGQRPVPSNRNPLMSMELSVAKDKIVTCFEDFRSDLWMMKLGNSR